MTTLHQFLASETPEYAAAWTVLDPNGEGITREVRLHHLAFVEVADSGAVLSIPGILPKAGRDWERACVARDVGTKCACVGRR